jgi:hypothetical protein
MESNQGWTTKQVEDLIIKMSGKHPITISIYIVFFASGVLDKKYQERYTCEYIATRDEKNDFKKRLQRYLRVSISSKKKKKKMKALP